MYFHRLCHNSGHNQNLKLMLHKYLPYQRVFGTTWKGKIGTYSMIKLDLRYSYHQNAYIVPYQLIKIAICPANTALSKTSFLCDR